MGSAAASKLSEETRVSGQGALALGWAVFPQRTEDTLANHARVCHCLELEAMLKTVDAVRATG